MKAHAKGVDGGLVGIENFDETLRDIIRLSPDLDTRALDAFANDRRVWSPAPRPNAGRGFPVIRLNGLELKTMPTVCRRVVCEIGGHAEVVAAIGLANVPVLATRSQAGVLAFGSDEHVRKAFGSYAIQDFGLHSIEVRRLRYDSQERGLLRQALSEALAREHALNVIRRHAKDLLSPLTPTDTQWAPLRKLVDGITGTVPKHPELAWREGVATRLDWANERLWLLLEPRTVFTGMTDENRAVATDFARERTVRRYNKPLNELFSFWANLFGGKELRALQISAGVDAVFELSDSTAYSRRAHS
jgi:hypothetical protein